MMRKELSEAITAGETALSSLRLAQDKLNSAKNWGLFDMFGGDTKKVSLLCENSLVNAVIDRFGEDVYIRKKDEDSFIATVSVNVSPTFFAWVFTFGGKMRIAEPESVAAEFKKIAERVIS